MNNVTINAGTVTGPHHKKKGEENQDSFFYMQENGYTVFAASDGAGSLELSEIGAKIAASTSVEEALDSLISGLNIEEALENGIVHARDVLLSREDWKQLGCTLALGIITDNGWGVGIVGDAFAVISLDESFHTFVQPESHAEYANITKLLTSSEPEPLIMYGTEHVKAVSLSSDGLLQTSIDLQTNKPSNGFWNPIIARACNNELDVQKFLEYMDINEKLVDDTSLIIASRNN